MLDKANKALDDKQYREAVRIFSDLLKNDPNNPLIYQGLAKAFYKLELLDESKRSCEKAIELNPDLPLPYATLSYIAYKHSGDIEQCYELAKKAYSLAPDLPEVLECFGFACLLKDQNEDGVRHLENALPNSPSKYETLNNLSISYARLNRFEEAYRYTLLMYNIRPSFKMLIRIAIAFMALTRVRIIASIILISSFFGSIFFHSPWILIIPFFYAVVLMIIGTYSILQKSTKAGIFSIVGSLTILIIILVTINI